TRRFSIRVTKVLAKTSITPNQVTFVSFLFLVAAAFLFTSGDYRLVLIGVVFMPIYQMLDCVDGELARIREIKSKYGKWLDNAFDNIGWGIFLTGATIGAFFTYPTLEFRGLPVMFMLGFAAMAGYYISSITYYYSIISFGEKKRFAIISEMSPWKIISKSVRGFSINVQMAIFMIGGVLNMLPVALFLYAIYANMFWVIRLVKYRRLG
ncbi:MAG: CDP-alcohol phosphatidyltransferase family protein, partial [Candidatus Aenigmatarchaeota archaeon]